jgi:hypothetical protein
MPAVQLIGIAGFQPAPRLHFSGTLKKTLTTKFRINFLLLSATELITGSRQDACGPIDWERRLPACFPVAF